MAETLRSLLPDAVRALAPDSFDQPIVPEPRATCGDCAMCSKSDETEGPLSEFFRPDTKCCTYHPILPNYLVGALLANTDPMFDEGRRRIRAKIERRIGVSPGWIRMPRKYEVLLEASRAAFGRSTTLRCPYYEVASGNCTIWRFRESVCSTFFCKHARGATAHTFWMALKGYMNVIEKTLSLWSSHAVCPDAREPVPPRTKLDVEDLEDRPPRAEVYEKFWGGWAGREEEFYVACFEHVRDLSRDEFAALVDDREEGKEALATLASTYEAVTKPKLLPLLVVNPELKKDRVEGGVAVASYSRYDVLRLSDDLMAVLGELEPDEPVDLMIGRMKRDHDVDVPPDLLLELQTHEVLVPPKNREGSDA